MRSITRAVAIALIVGCAVALAFLVPSNPEHTMGSVYPLRSLSANSGQRPAPHTYRDSGPPLLFVDQEHVPGPGLLARAEVSGEIRLFGYEVTRSRRPLYFAWVLRNTGTQPVAVTVTNHAAAPPGLRYLPLAASVQKAFLSGSAPDTFEIAPGHIHILRNRATARATFGELAFSIYDLKVSGPLDAMDIATANLVTLGASNLPSAYPGGSGVGALFPHDTRNLIITPSGKRNGMRIAGHDRDDPTMAAQDSVTGARNFDEGNYGVTYNVRIVFPPSRTRSIHLWVTAGACALRVAVLLRSGPLRGQVIQLPAVGSLPSGDVGTALTTLLLSPYRQSVFSFAVLPPAASCTPIGVWEEPVNPNSLAVRLYQIPARWWLASRGTGQA